LAEEGYDPKLGARPMRRAIQRLLEDPLSDYILAGGTAKNIEAVMNGNKIAFKPEETKKIKENVSIN
ncbi:MAG: hypothetical protein ACOYIT_01425, partial [Christensenellales bacterium]